MSGKYTPTTVLGTSKLQKKEHVTLPTLYIGIRRKIKMMVLDHALVASVELGLVRPAGN